MPSLSCTVIGISPFEFADAQLVVGVCRAGGLGVLDLGRDRKARAAALAHVASHVESFGVRVPFGVEIEHGDLPPQAKVIVIDSASTSGAGDGATCSCKSRPSTKRASRSRRAPAV